jgi:putative peptidoglycan lipid II flippase
LLRRRGRYYFTLGWKNPAVGEVILLMGPRLLGVAVVQVNFWANTWLASNMAEGSLSGIYYGFALMLMAQTAIAQSIATAAMPTFSTQYALGKIDEIRSSLAATLRGVLLLSVPAAIGLMLLRVPIIQLILQRGSFTEHSTELVAWALLWYAAGLVGHSVLEILARTFYAMHDTKTPVLVGVVAMGLNVVFSVSFSALFSRIGWMPHGGLALANSLATGLEAVGLFWLMRRRLNGIAGRDVLTGSLQSALATLGMAAALWGWLALTDGRSVWLVAGGGVILGAIAYGLAVLALGVREARRVVGMVVRRVKQ